MIKANEIGFNEIQNTIKEKCKTLSAKLLVDNLHFLTDYKRIDTLLQESYEMKTLLLGIKDFPQENYFDCTAFLKELRIENTCISQQDMRTFLLSYSAIRDILSFFANEKQELPILSETYKNLLFNEEILKECSRIIDSDGEIKKVVLLCLER